MSAETFSSLVHVTSDTAVFPGPGRWCRVMSLSTTTGQDKTGNAWAPAIAADDGSNGWHLAKIAIDRVCRGL